MRYKHANKGDCQMAADYFSTYVRFFYCWIDGCPNNFCFTSGLLVFMRGYAKHPCTRLGCIHGFAVRPVRP